MNLVDRVGGGDAFSAGWIYALINNYKPQEAIAASKCPHVHAGVVESLPAATRAITGNGVNVLAMGAFYVAPQTACDIADAYLSNSLGSGWEWWHNFYEFHKLAIDELEAFDYEEYKKNGFKVNKLGDYDLTLDFDKKPE